MPPMDNCNVSALVPARNSPPRLKHGQPNSRGHREPPGGRERGRLWHRSCPDPRVAPVRASGHRQRQNVIVARANEMSPGATGAPAKSVSSLWAPDATSLQCPPLPDGAACSSRFGSASSCLSVFSSRSAKAWSRPGIDVVIELTIGRGRSRFLAGAAATVLAGLLLVPSAGRATCGDYVVLGSKASRAVHSEPAQPLQVLPGTSQKRTRRRRRHSGPFG